MQHESSTQVLPKLSGLFLSTRQVLRFHPHRTCTLVSQQIVQIILVLICSTYPESLVPRLILTMLIQDLLSPMLL